MFPSDLSQIFMAPPRLGLAERHLGTFFCGDRLPSVQVCLPPSRAGPVSG